MKEWYSHKRTRSDKMYIIDHTSEKLTPSRDSTLTILLSLENRNSLPPTKSPIRKKRKIDQNPLPEEDPDQTSSQTGLESDTMNDSQNDLDLLNLKNFQFTNSNIISSFSLQTHTTLPKQAESTWTNAKVAHLEGIRYSQRTSFLRGALDSSVLEDWALQLDSLPSFLWKMVDFRTDFHKLRL